MRTSGSWFGKKITTSPSRNALKFWLPMVFLYATELLQGWKLKTKSKSPRSKTMTYQTPEIQSGWKLDRNRKTFTAGTRNIWWFVDSSFSLGTKGAFSGSSRSFSGELNGALFLLLRCLCLKIEVLNCFWNILPVACRCSCGAITKHYPSRFEGCSKDLEYYWHLILPQFERSWFTKAKLPYPWQYTACTTQIQGLNSWMEVFRLVCTVLQGYIPRGIFRTRRVSRSTVGGLQNSKW